MVTPVPSLAQAIIGLMFAARVDELDEAEFVIHRCVLDALAHSNKPKTVYDSPAARPECATLKRYAGSEEP